MARTPSSGPALTKTPATITGITLVSTKLNWISNDISLAQGKKCLFEVNGQQTGPWRPAEWQILSKSCEDYHKAMKPIGGGAGSRVCPWDMAANSRLINHNRADGLLQSGTALRKSVYAIWQPCRLSTDGGELEHKPRIQIQSFVGNVHNRYVLSLTNIPVRGFLFPIPIILGGLSCIIELNVEHHLDFFGGKSNEISKYDPRLKTHKCIYYTVRCVLT